MGKREASLAWSNLVKQLSAYSRSLRGGERDEKAARKLLAAMERFRKAEGLRGPG
jgi:hypothetical protein